MFTTSKTFDAVGDALAFTAMTIALCLALTMSEQASAQQLKIATLAPDGSSWMNAFNDAADAVEEQTDGRVSIRYYPGGVMGDATAIFRRMRLGQLNGGAFTLGVDQRRGQPVFTAVRVQ